MKVMRVSLVFNFLLLLHAVFRFYVTVRLITLAVTMKKLLLMSVVLGALLSQANAIPSLKIIANKLVGGVRFVIYENCGWPGVSAYWRPPTNVGL